MCEIPILEALPGWLELSAVSKGRVAFADGNKFFNRSGTTIAETAEIIVEILHGCRFSAKVARNRLAALHACIAHGSLKLCL